MTTTEETIDDTDVISPESVWRFLRSVTYPLLVPHRYFAWSGAQPRRYLKATQALTLVFVVFWLLDRRMTAGFRSGGLDVTTLNETQAMVFQVGRLALSILAVWGVPFFNRIGAYLARVSLSWRDPTRIGAFLAPYTVLGSFLQFAAAPLVASGIFTLVTVAANALAFVMLGKVSVWRALAATAAAVLTETILFGVLGVGWSLALELSGVRPAGGWLHL